MAVLFEAYLYPNGATIEVKNGEPGDYEPIEGNILPDPTTWFNSTGRQARFVYDRTFREWNSQWDGNGTSYAPGDVATNKASYYAIWEEPPERNYIATESELTSIADAIRSKGGTSAALTYPAGFVSAINNIPSGGGGLTVTDLTKSRTAFNAPDNPEDLVFSASATGLNIAICTLRSYSYGMVAYLYQAVYDVAVFKEELVVFGGVCEDAGSFLTASFYQQTGTYEISQVMDEVNGEDVTEDWYIESCRIYHG